ncbi:MAG: GNAT family N-acetyltransferase [Acidimicrobiia bacterium]
MDFELLSDIVQFRDRTRTLLADEARNNLILGILGHIIETPDAYEVVRMMVVTDGDVVTACGLITTPPQNLILADTISDEALAVLADRVAGAEIDVPRVIGIRPTVDRFVDCWRLRTGQDAEPEMGQGVFALREVTPPPPVTGRMRRADVGDFDTVLRWSRAFAAEALPDDPTDDTRLQRSVLRRLEGEVAAGTRLWEVDGIPVSMSSHTGPTGSGIRVNAVYTPPEHRRNGYASALVATHSQELLDSGYAFCFLYTDLANPTSNKIYQAVGYDHVAESAVFRFNRAT